MPAGKVIDPRELADADSQFIDLNGITVHYKKLGIRQTSFNPPAWIWIESVQLGKGNTRTFRTIYSYCLRLGRIRVDNPSQAGNLDGR